MNKSYLLFLSIGLWFGAASGMESVSKKEEKSKESSIDESRNKEKSILKDIFQQIKVKSETNYSKTNNSKSSFVYTPSDTQSEFLKKIITDCTVAEIKEILDQEESPQFYSARTNVLLLVGTPGVGKTTLAKAIACKLGKCFFVTSGDLLKEHRNGTSERLKHVVESILSESGKKILVLDEINKLLENYTSEYKDASETSSTLWEIMDAQKDNLDFFLIATANESKKLPIQIQDRFGMSVIGINKPTNQERQRLIINLLSRVKMKKHEQLDGYIPQLVELTENFTPRELTHLIGAVEKKARSADKTNPLIRRELFQQVLQERNAKYQEFWDARVPVSDEERRHQQNIEQNRLHHEASLTLQRQQHEDNKETQYKTTELNGYIQTE